MQALHSFRDNKSSLLIATPQAARGLDLPAVSHVYNLGPPEDPVEYLHRAGRAGRIGSPVGGMVLPSLTILPADIDVHLCSFFMLCLLWQGVGMCWTCKQCQSWGQSCQPALQTIVTVSSHCLHSLRGDQSHHACVCITRPKCASTMLLTLYVVGTGWHKL